MGQYFIAVNLDKREWISPEAFGDGSKLLEFTSASNGMLEGFSILMASSNGKGGAGEAYRQGFSTDPANFEAKTGEKLLHSWLGSHDHNGNRTPADNIECRTFVPALSGRWCGDRVAFVGDYTDKDLFMTDEFRQYGHNIYKVACNIFDDISDELVEQMHQFDCGRTHDVEAVVERFLSRSLLYDYKHKVTTGKGKRAKCRWDLTWMDAEVFDSVLLVCDTTAALKATKEWMRKQIITDWQRKLLKFYQEPGARRIPTPVVHEMEQLGVYGLHREHVPILPSEKYLKAALAVERATVIEDDAVTTATPLETEVATKTGLRVREQRVIQIP